MPTIYIDKQEQEWPIAPEMVEDYLEYEACTVTIQFKALVNPEQLEALRTVFGELAELDMLWADIREGTISIDQ